MSNILEINKSIKINKGDLNLFITIDKIRADGSVEKIVDDKPANSLVANYARMLMAAMSNTLIENGLHFNSSDATSGSSTMADFFETFEIVSAVTAGNPTRVTFANNMSTFDNAGDQGLQFMGIGGISPNLNGFWPAADVTWISDSIADINLNTTGSPVFVDEGARVRLWEDVVGNSSEAASTTFGRSILKVGRDGSPNVTDQQCLLNEYDHAESATTIEPFELLITDVVVSSPSFNFTTEKSELFFSAIVTNNTGNSETINEIGLYTTVHRITNDNRYSLIARDIISPGVTLLQGESAVVSYRFQTGLDADGGLLEQFLRIMFRQFDPDVGNTTIVDINSANHSWGEDSGFIHTMGMAGEGVMNGVELGFRSDEIGIQVGTSSTVVALDDRSLVARVDHGEASGELRQYGQIIHDFQISGSVASFKLVKYFENVSGGTINLNEVGIYSGTDEFQAQIYGVVCIHREVLTSTQAVANNEILKVELSVELTVV